MVVGSYNFHESTFSKLEISKADVFLFNLGWCFPLKTGLGVVGEGVSYT